MAAKQKIIFLINPSSGSSLRRNSAMQDIISKSVDKDLFEPEIVCVGYPTEVYELAMKAVEGGFHGVAAVGGDGTVNLAARALNGKSAFLGIVPNGSGNGLAHHLGIPLSLRKAVEVINQQHIISMDTFTVNDQLVISVAGVGFDAMVAKEYAHSKMRGFMPYFKIVTERYPKYKPKKYSLKIDDLEIETRALFVTCTNSGQFGYNTVISPDARVDDGLLDLCITRKAPLVKAPFLAHQLFTRKINESEYVEIYKARKVEIRRKKNRRINLDGESLKLKKKLVFEVNSHTLRIVVPKSYSLE